jgi:hypothetical protein
MDETCRKKVEQVPEGLLVAIGNPGKYVVIFSIVTNDLHKWQAL